MRLSFLAVLCALAALPLRAHEFWISPDPYTVEPGGKIKAEIRVGQDFVGAGYAYIPQNFKRFEVIFGDEVFPVEGRIGDQPALAMQAPREGLAVAVHQTKDYALTYSDWETFELFTRSKDAEWAPARHLERGFDRASVRERYSRYAKSLIAVGNGAGQDREVGLLTEIVALANPYTDDLSGGLPVRVLFGGAPRDNVQVEVFARDGAGEVTVRKYRTDAVGVAVLPVKPGVEYLVDAVVLRELESEDPLNGPAWESLWASLTFRTPE